MIGSATLLVKQWLKERVDMFHAVKIANQRRCKVHAKKEQAEPEEAKPKGSYPEPTKGTTSKYYKAVPIKKFEVPENKPTITQSASSTDVNPNQPERKVELKKPRQVRLTEATTTSKAMPKPNQRLIKEKNQT